MKQLTDYIECCGFGHKLCITKIYEYFSFTLENRLSTVLYFSLF